MARRINVDRNEKRWKEKNGGIRPTNIRSGIKYFLIVTEGVKTEPHYFESLKKTIPRHAVQHIDIKGAGDNTYRVVKLAKETREKSLRYYDQVWAVFDRDSFPAEHFNQAIQQAKSWGIETAWTNEAFELWYLLHFQFVQHGMSREQYRPFLERELTQRMGQPFIYEKNRADMYDLLQQYGDENRAIEWAKQLDAHFEGQTDFANHNPCTKVHVLIETLNAFRHTFKT